MNPLEKDASNLGDRFASRFMRIVPRARLFGCAHSSLIGMPSVSKRWTSKSGILYKPTSFSYSPLAKKRSVCWPPDICTPAFLRRPVPNGVVFFADQRLKLVRLSETHCPSDTCDKRGLRQLRVDP